MLSPIDVPNIADLVFQQLYERILAGQFEPGEKLNLNNLEEQLQVSRTPLKSAIERLQSQGLVDVQSRRGVFITQLEPSDILECFEARIALETYCLRHTFAPSNERKVQQLLRLLEEMDGFFKDETTWIDEVPRFTDLDRQLHTGFIELADNKRIEDLHNNIKVLSYITMTRSRFTYEDGQQTLSEHRTIAQAILAGDLPSVVAATTDHLQQAGERAARRLGNEGEV